MNIPLKKKNFPFIPKNIHLYNVEKVITLQSDTHSVFEYPLNVRIESHVEYFIENYHDRDRNFLIQFNFQLNMHASNKA